MLRVRVKYPGGSNATISIDGSAKFSELKSHIETGSKIPSYKQKLLIGFPPKPLFGEPNNALSSLNIRSGETIIVEEDASALLSIPVQVVPSSVQSNSSSTAISNQASAAAANNHQNPIDVNDGVAVRREIPSDNSCLFNAFRYVYRGAKSTSSAELRELIAGIVMSDPVTYSDAMLGKANDLYCQQIMDPNVWGGGVELSILASNYNVEIVAIDISTLHAYHFGQSIGTSERVFLLYSGIHYDAVALSPLADAPQEFDETMFSVHDASMLAKAVRLASDLKKSGQFTDVTHFKLRCQDCQQGFVGQAEALDHARASKHQNFTEY